MKVPNDEDRRGNRSTIGEFRNMNYMKNITINLATLQNDTKLAIVIKATNNLDIDTLTIQESRALMTFEDNSIKG